MASTRLNLKMWHLQPFYEEDLHFQELKTIWTSIVMAKWGLFPHYVKTNEADKRSSW